MGQLAAQGPTADHQQPPGALGQVEDRFVCQIAGCFEALDEWSSGTGAGGDDGLLEPERGAGDLDRTAIGERGVAKEHVDAQRPEPPGRVLVTDAGPEAAHALHGRGEIRFRGDRRAPGEPWRVVEIGVETRGAQERLGGYAAEVQAIATQEALFHQRHRGTEASSARRGDQAGGTGADDD